MDEEKEAVLGRLSFWPRLTEEERELARRSSRFRAYDREEILHHDSGDCLGMILLVTGAIRVSALSDEGREVTLFRLRAGDTCVLSASCLISQITFDTQIQTLEPTRLLVMGTGAFARLTEQNIYARCFLYEMATERFSEVMWTLQQILFLGFDKRLAVFLWDEYSRTGQSTLSMTHEAMARDTGSAREVVTRMLRRFSQEGLVELRRGSVRILQPDRLRKLAGGM